MKLHRLKIVRVGEVREILSKDLEQLNAVHDLWCWRHHRPWTMDRLWAVKGEDGDSLVFNPREWERLIIEENVA